MFNLYFHRDRDLTKFEITVTPRGLEFSTELER